MSASPQPWSRPLRGVLITAAAAAALVACGGDDGSTTTTATPGATLSGVAAVGSPIVGGQVDVTCAGGAGLSTTTNSGGAWQVTTSGQTLPCAVQVNGGTVDGVAHILSLHSVAFDFSNVNVTPLTELVFARAVAGNPQAWFNAPAFAALTAANVNAAITQIVNALGIASALGERNPLATAFQPQAGDSIDDLLTALNAALQTLGTDFAALLAAAGANNFADFAGLPAAVAQAQAADTGGGGAGGAGALSCETRQFVASAVVTVPTAAELAAFAKTYTSGSNTVVLSATGGLTVNGKGITVASTCLVKEPTGDMLMLSWGTAMTVGFGAIIYDNHIDFRGTGVNGIVDGVIL